MQYDLLIRGARVVTSTHTEAADVAISGGKIAAVGDMGSAIAYEVVNARGLVLMPGVIDTQVHFREPGLTQKEDLESGTRSAILGGVTSILEMPNTSPTTTTEDALREKLRLAEGRAWGDYGFFIGASTENVELLPGLEQLPGVPGVKIFVGSSTGPLLVGQEDEIRAVLAHGKTRCPIHAETEERNRLRRAEAGKSPHVREHPNIRDAESARLATEMVLRLSRETGRPVHILHVSTADEPPLIAQAKRDGVRVTCEVTPQHLWFAAPECYNRLGTRIQMNPPIRTNEHREGLWRALKEGVFDVFGSDHAPHTLDEKAQAYPDSPSGVPGVQTMLPALMTFVAQGRIDLETVVRMTSENAATLYEMRGKGLIAEGVDADLVLVDPDATYTFERSIVASKCGWSPFEGEKFTGRVEHVFLRGRQVVRERELIGAPTGKMLEFR